jgi:uncharacterized protein YyaL (SSP411 family)
VREASAAQHGPHRFSPRPNRASEIPWREWGPDALDEARAEDKPVLLAVSALWCHWCHVMDETTYSDDRVIERLRTRFIPIRLDADARPDVDARYNAGGWPTTAVLDPAGELVAAVTYVSPEPMVQMLDRVTEAWHVNREAIATRIEDLRRRRAAAAPSAGASAAGSAGTLAPALVAEVADAVDAAFDEEHGGFGPAESAPGEGPHEPKFARPDALRLLLYRHRRDGDAEALHRARRTLERMSAPGGLLDGVEGGWFRYATRRDWSEPHYEKLAADQGRMLLVLADLARGSEEDAALARHLAERTIEYASGTLSTPEGGFAGSQDADEAYYALDAAGRAAAAAPLVDDRVYAASTALLARGYLACGVAFDEPEWATRGATAGDFLWSRLRGGEAGVYHYLNHREGGPSQLGLLADQAETALALLDAYEVTGRGGYLEAARRLARLIDEHWREPGGACLDTAIDHDRSGLLAERRRPLPENAAVAEAHIRLGRLTHDEGYLETAREILEALAGAALAAASAGRAVEAAAFALAVERLLRFEPEIKIVGGPPEHSPERALDLQADELHRAALRLPLPLPFVTVQHLDPEADADLLVSLGLPPAPRGVAYVCVGTSCSAPVDRPEALLHAIEETLSAPAL